MLRSGGLLLLALLVSGMIAPTPTEGGEPKITDWGLCFSDSAKEHAMARLMDVNQRFKVEVMIETFPSIPDNMKAQYQPDNPEEKANFFRRWAVSRTEDENIKGIYILICKSPGHLQIEPDKTTRVRAFTLEDSAKLIKRMAPAMGKKQFDAALTDMVETIQLTLERSLGQHAGRAAPPVQRNPIPGQRAERPALPQQGFPNQALPPGGAGQSTLMGWICLGVVALFVFWVIMALARAFSGRSNYGGGMPGGGPGGMPGGGYGPGYGPGYGGGGGGGFFSSFLGSMFGSAAGNWMFDSFSRGGGGGGGGHSSSWGDTSAPQGGYGPSEPDVLPADQPGAGDFSGDTGNLGGGDFGGGDSGGGGFAGGGGDFGGGGGGDFGGGGGGDFGGGGSGGDFGGDS